MNPQFKKLQELIGVKFNSADILYQALVHRSFLNENKGKISSSNERLEFLGDAVLELWATENLYHQFPDFPEGDLTNLRSLVVCTENLASIALKIDISSYILLSRGEESHKGRQNLSILADTFESIVGAVYLDQGYAAAAGFLDKFVAPTISDISRQKIYKDPKSVFQEIAQSQRGITPHYTVLSETGPDHQKVFEVAAYIGDNLVTTGKGSSKQKAEEAAATAAAKILND